MLGAQVPRNEAYEQYAAVTRDAAERRRWAPARPAVLIDTHAHLDMPEFAADLPAVLERAREGGPRPRSSASPRGWASLRRNLEIAAAHPGFVSATAGVHPHDAAGVNDASWGELARLAAQGPQVVAIGETGLDLFRGPSARERQAELFARHIALGRAPRQAAGRALARRRRGGLGDARAGGGRRRSAACSTASPGPGEVGRARARAGCLPLDRRGGDLTRGSRAAGGRAPDVPVERMVVETDAPYSGRRSAGGSATSRPTSHRSPPRSPRSRGSPSATCARITTRTACALLGLPGPAAAQAIAYAIRNALYLNVTNRCSNRCVFCTRERQPAGQGARPGPGARADGGGDPRRGGGRLGPTTRWSSAASANRCCAGTWCARSPRSSSGGAARVRINTNGQSRLFLGRDILPEMTGDRRRPLGEPQRPGRRRLREDLHPRRRRARLRAGQGLHPRGARSRTERDGERGGAPQPRRRGLPAHRRGTSWGWPSAPPLQRGGAMRRGSPSSATYAVIRLAPRAAFELQSRAAMHPTIRARHAGGGHVQAQEDSLPDRFLRVVARGAEVRRQLRPELPAPS